MSIINDAIRMQAGLQISEWNKNTINSINQAKQSYTSIATQLEAMRTNPDYTAGDIAEVETMLTELNALALSMTV